MNGGLYALFERLHGHLALLGLAALLHPVITLGRGRLTPAGRVAAALVAGLIALATLAGWWLYGAYRREIKPTLALYRLEVALAFEVKEHLAFFCLVLTLCGVAALLSSPGHAPTLRLARWMFALAWLCGVVAATLGLLVSASAAPAW